MTLRVAAATANPGKLREIRAIIGNAVEVVPRPPEIPDVVEDAPTLVGNARLKAQAICGATAMPAVADDTGLEVDALGGAPGVRSARYAGEEGDAAANIAKLLMELRGVPASDRAARFRTVAVLVWPDGRELVAEGVVEGRIVDTPRGDRGFGYDPVFQPEGSDLTFAQMSEADKNAISHRGRAFRRLQELLAA